MDTVRILGPQAEALEKKIQKLSKDIRAALPKNADLLTVLETADSVTLEAENDKLLIGGTELISKKWSFIIPTGKSIR